MTCGILCSRHLSWEAELRPQMFHSPLGGPEQPATFAALSNHETHTLPQVVPVNPRVTANYLPSCSIDTLSLILPEESIIERDNNKRKSW